MGRPIISGHRILGYRAHQVDAFVREHCAEHGIAPTYATICTSLGINSKGEVSRIVASLEARGLLSRVGRGRVRRIGIGGPGANR